jgi:hypothetical protein
LQIDDTPDLGGVGPHRSGEPRPMPVDGPQRPGGRRCRLRFDNIAEQTEEVYQSVA